MADMIANWPALAQLLPLFRQQGNATAPMQAPPGWEGQGWLSTPPPQVPTTAAQPPSAQPGSQNFGGNSATFNDLGGVMSALRGGMQDLGGVQGSIATTMPSPTIQEPAAGTQGTMVDQIMELINRMGGSQAQAAPPQAPPPTGMAKYLPMLGQLGQSFVANQIAARAGPEAQNRNNQILQQQQWSAQQNALDRAEAEKLWQQHFGQQNATYARDMALQAAIQQLIRQNDPAYQVGLERDRASIRNTDSEIRHRQAMEEVAQQESSRKSRYDEMRGREIDAKIGKVNEEIAALQGKLSPADAADVASLQKEFQTAYSAEEKARILGEIRAITGRYRQGGQQQAPAPMGGGQVLQFDAQGNPIQ